MSILTYTEEAFVNPEYDVQTVLELSCAAQRINKDYVKQTENIYDDSGNLLNVIYPNKSLIQFSLGMMSFGSNNLHYFNKLTVLDEDKSNCTKILHYFRRLMFSAVKGDNEFHLSVNSILESGKVTAKELGIMACLPSVYKRDFDRNQIEKRIKLLENAFLGEVGIVLFNKDAEILESNLSKNFAAYNVNAIIDNKMASWISKTDLKHGNCVITKAKVKEHSNHYKHGNAVTRLNFVRAQQ